MRHTRNLTAAEAVEKCRRLGAEVRKGKGGEYIVKSPAITRGAMVVNIRRRDTTRALAMLLQRLTQTHTANQVSAEGQAAHAQERPGT